MLQNTITAHNPQRPTACEQPRRWSHILHSQERLPFWWVKFGEYWKIVMMSWCLNLSVDIYRLWHVPPWHVHVCSQCVHVYYIIPPLGSSITKGWEETPPKGNSAYQLNSRNWLSSSRVFWNKSSSRSRPSLSIEAAKVIFPKAKPLDL